MALPPSSASKPNPDHHNRSPPRLNSWTLHPAPGAPPSGPANHLRRAASLRRIPRPAALSSNPDHPVNPLSSTFRPRTSGPRIWPLVKSGLFKHGALWDKRAVARITWDSQTTDAARSVLPSVRSHRAEGCLGLWTLDLSQIQRAFDSQPGLLHHMRINLRRRHILVAQQILHRADVRAPFQQMCGK